MNRIDWPKVVLWAVILMFCGAFWYFIIGALAQVFKGGVGY